MFRGVVARAPRMSMATNFSGVKMGKIFMGVYAGEVRRGFWNM